MVRGLGRSINGFHRHRSYVFLAIGPPEVPATQNFLKAVLPGSANKVSCAFWPPLQLSPMMRSPYVRSTGWIYQWEASQTPTQAPSAAAITSLVRRWALSRSLVGQQLVGLFGAVARPRPFAASLH